MMLVNDWSGNKLYFMKKLMMIGCMLLATVGVGTVAVAQPPHAKAWGKRAKQQNFKNYKQGRYYYYPSHNVYYSPAAHRYWYPNHGVWVSANVLPRTVAVYNQPSYVVYGDDDIWRDNRVHYDRYRYYQPAPVRRYARPGVSVDVHARF
jgi:hypothetical protein